MGIDSTVYDVPDTPANDTAFGRPSAGPRGDGAFPQCASSVWSNWEPTSKSAWFSSTSTAVNGRWSPHCSGI